MKLDQKLLIDFQTVKKCDPGGRGCLSETIIKKCKWKHFSDLQRIFCIKNIEEKPI